MTDPINPDHYRRFPVEVIEITEHLTFNLGSAVKYCARAGHKDPSKDIEDLRKAAWFVNREIQRLGGDPEQSVNDAKADAWDEGIQAGYDHSANQSTPSGISTDPPMNPYLEATRD